jgi:tRNA 2-thiouridine synthesizing protein A
MPIVKLAGAIKEINVGEVIEVLATDPGALADVPAWARKTGNEVIAQTTENEVLRFYIRRRV